MKRCTLSELLPDETWTVVCVGDLQVYYDSDLYAARISVNDDSGNVFSNTLIGVNTVMSVSIFKIVLKNKSILFNFLIEENINHKCQ